MKNNKNVSGWVIRNYNGTIKMTHSKHIGSVLIIIVKCMTLKDYILLLRIMSFKPRDQERLKNNYKLL